MKFKNGHNFLIKKYIQLNNLNFGGDLGLMRLFILKMYKIVKKLTELHLISPSDFR